jgi:uncharacterized protein (UPF0332 family)
MNLERLFREGHLKKIPPSMERAEKSIKVSARYLSEAKQTARMGISDLAVIAAYSSIFHAARAILFKDGVGERAHFAIYEYLVEKHKGFGEELINAFDMYRKLRHSVAYGLDTHTNKEDAEGITEFAEEFLGKVKKYLKMEK